jgi:toxin-antitoxin system PIN domain toxin
MIFWDVNLWVYAFRPDSPLHGVSRDEIEAGCADPNGFLFCPSVAASFLRLVTNRGIFSHPSQPSEAWDFIDALQFHPLARFGAVDEMTLGIFKHICLLNKSAGNEIPDALLAALATRYDCRFVTADTGFTKYAGLELKLIGEVQ